MKVKSLLLIVVFIVSMAGASFGQRKVDIELRNNAIDTATLMVWTGANFAYQFPFGTLRETFKANMNIGFDVTLKSSSNWTYSFDFNYLFGSKVRNQAGILGDDMLTSHGDLIDGNGMIATIYLEGRYWNLSLGLGKIIPFGKWRNSGLWLRLNGGYFEHKVRINDVDNQVPQLSGDYKKGYDQRAGGFCLTQFVGYVFMRKVRVASFYAGLEVSEIWTKSNRNYSFLLMGKDNSKKFSVLFGPKIGWVIPLYEKRKIQTLYRY